tara:strand:- start:583 stop:1359 length:777 start_codon:yes stop_codon:yes gene_type:complete
MPKRVTRKSKTTHRKKKTLKGGFWWGGNEDASDPAAQIAALQAQKDAQDKAAADEKKHAESAKGFFGFGTDDKEDTKYETEMKRGVKVWADLIAWTFPAGSESKPMASVSRNPSAGKKALVVAHRGTEQMLKMDVADAHAMAEDNGTRADTMKYFKPRFDEFVKKYVKPRARRTGTGPNENRDDKDGWDGKWAAEPLNNLYSVYESDPTTDEYKAITHGAHGGARRRKMKKTKKSKKVKKSHKKAKKSHKKTKKSKKH